MNRSCPCELSLVAQDYLNIYRGILESMIQGMTCAELSDSISGNFIVQMIPHHRAAIEMSRNLLKYTTFIPLQNIALGIISEQTRSIENMRQVLGVCRCRKNSGQEICRYQERTQQILHTMFSQMKCACASNQINADFMREMIPHHRGAVEMSENALQSDICPELVPILNAIIVSQKQGICQMQRLLCRTRC